MYILYIYTSNQSEHSINIVYERIYIYMYIYIHIYIVYIYNIYTIYMYILSYTIFIECSDWLLVVKTASRVLLPTN